MRIKQILGVFLFTACVAAWDFIDFSGNGIKGQIIERVESEAIIYSEIIMKDKDGNTLLKINSTKNKI